MEGRLPNSTLTDSPISWWNSILEKKGWTHGKDSAGWPLVREKSGKFDFSSRSGKSQGIWQIGQGNFKTKKVRERAGNFIILAQNMCCSRYFDYLKCEKSVDFFSRWLRSLKAIKPFNFRTFCAKKLFKDFICFICRIREVHFSELVKGIVIYRLREDK